MSDGSAVVEAAGGVLWRPASGGSGVEVALVHRPKYDDWSLPKGKLDPFEHPVVAAVREVQEETGVTSAPGRPLGQLRYLKDGRPKRVRYWGMRALWGDFTPHAEIDQVMWLPPREAMLHLAPDHDRRILAEFVRDPRDTWPLLLVRHASAGSRERWDGDDRERPLDDLGRRQARALVPVLEAYQVDEVVSADVLRCLDTVGPFASTAGLTVESEPLMSEIGYHSHPEAAEARLLELAVSARRVAVCSQRGPVPELVDRLCRRLKAPLPRLNGTTSKGGFLAVHLTGGSPVTVLTVEEMDAPPTVQEQPA